MKAQRATLSILFSIILHTSLLSQWSPIPGLEGRPIIALLVMDSTIFAGGHGNTLLRSTNNGASWVNIAGVIEADTITGLGADSAYIFVGTSRGAYRSSNKGDTWEAIPLILGSVYHFLSHAGSIFAGTMVGVYRSTDSGTSWTSVSSGLGSYRIIIGLVSDGARIYALADLQEGVYVSSDEGASWSSAGLTGVWGSALAAIDTNVFAGMNNGMFLYSGSGTSWSPRNNGLPDPPRIYSLRAIRRVLFAGSSNGVYRSTDLGVTWLQTNENNPLNESVLSIAANERELIVGTFSGLWRRSLSGLVASVPSTNNPREFELFQNYPNPFNPATVIRYSLPVTGFVTLKVYNVLGREVATLVNEQKAPGIYTVTWNASNLASGVYYYRLTAFPSVGSGQGYVETKKMILVR